MNPTRFSLSALTAALLTVSTQAQDLARIDEEILVTADFRQSSLLDLAASASVIDADTIRQRGADHLSQVLNTAPNVNFSAGTSRARFFQIRGIGERSQFVEPVNPSVGLIIDGIDMTGIGAGATTLDIQQVEVLRGPQGTLYGANAMAGLINMVSGAPTESFEGTASLGVAEYNTRTASGVISGPVLDTLSYRLAAGTTLSDGYQENAFLGIDDNADIDEQTLRGKLHWDPRSDLSVDITAFYVDVDNGYDGFSLDNTRTTLSDQPGHDRQESTAGSVRLQWQATEAFDVEALVSHAQSDLEYGYDEDWAYEDICVDFECVFDGYNSFDNYLRDNDNTSVDLRLVSRNAEDELGWVVGAYYRDQSEDLRREYTYLEEDFRSAFSTENTALYGQLDIPLAERLTLKTGLRHETRDADYADSDGAVFSPSEDMWGGKLALEYRDQADNLWYALASRGFKAGGFNSSQTLAANEREFDTETLWNYEAGWKGEALEGALQTRVAVFYQDRDDVQTKQSRVVPDEGDNCPCSFIDYTTNAAAGSARGLEFEANVRLNRMTDVFASVGLLDSEFDDFQSFAHVGANEETGEPQDLSGHDLPHAPSYQFAVGALFNLTEHWYARVELEGKDDFYFSSRHEAQSDAYELLNGRVGYRADSWEVALWGRNLTDEDVKTRGFGAFGNDPRDGYETKPYYQFGEPRVVGVDFNLRF
ncbi:TonB-dependent receptor [Marinimicrobium sp. C6131]|uniref:TonB-dependent receptor n=1 Tax=Marinimicrobium sp. C6131 TaxID=3022676 RepID=UPI00223CEE09|nr:TonB-dependent receptor [Marinimicrobium sp. C6131]UZJ44660.1 TonB-dependent receptor [Marinimicrobium sp. C6131]